MNCIHCKNFTAAMMVVYGDSIRYDKSNWIRYHEYSMAWRNRPSAPERTVHSEESATSMDANERRMVESRDVPIDWVALTHSDMTPSPTLHFSRHERCPLGLMAGHAQLFFPPWMGASFD